MTLEHVNIRDSVSVHENHLDLGSEIFLSCMKSIKLFKEITNLFVGHGCYNLIGSPQTVLN